MTRSLESQLRLGLEDGRSVSALWSEAPRADWALVYAPGAGSNLNDPFGRYAAVALQRAGVSCLRFQFPYSEAGRSAPDRPPLLEATWRAAIAAARTLAPRLIAGGRSMGGRIASQVAAQAVAVEALALFAYPLHPPKRPDQRRDSHLAAVSVPLLFCSGDRDDFASRDELRQLAQALPNARLHVLAGADHGFNVLKSSGRGREDVWREAVEALLRFAAETLPEGGA